MEQVGMGVQLAPLMERGAAGDGARRGANLQNAMPLVNAQHGRDAGGACTAPEFRKLFQPRNFLRSRRWGRRKRSPVPENVQCQRPLLIYIFTVRERRVWSAWRVAAAICRGGPPTTPSRDCEG